MTHFWTRGLCELTKPPGVVYSHVRDRQKGMKSIMLGWRKRPSHFLREFFIVALCVCICTCMCTCMCVGALVPWHTYGGQRVVCGSYFSPLLGALEIKCRLSDLAVGGFTCWAFLLAQEHHISVGKVKQRMGKGQSFQGRPCRETPPEQRIEEARDEL